ncbi:MAG TPA: prolipoprotein diacylglyceryl transferase family protein, partial [Candidatus Babeliaceae bacterium]|nr:prolipoprotein diacylglyceryl transferase family protein [Candidatus Babeliaceae bacterium]
MYPVLLHLWGPFSIHSYGVAIAMGVILFILTTFKHPLRKCLMDADQFHTMIGQGILIGILGGKAGYIVAEKLFSSSLWDLFNFWQGGFSVLGSISALMVYA